MTTAGRPTSAVSPSSRAAACWTGTAASGSRRSASSSGRGCIRSRASDSCSSGLGWASAGRSGSMLPPSRSPTTSGSRSSRRPVMKLGCWRHLRPSPADGWIRPGRCGSCGCCPACRRIGWACISGCTTPSLTGPLPWPPSGRCWTLLPTRPPRSHRRGRPHRSRRAANCCATTCTGAGGNSLAAGGA